MLEREFKMFNAWQGNIKHFKVGSKIKFNFLEMFIGDGSGKK